MSMLGLRKPRRQSFSADGTKSPLQGLNNLAVIYTAQGKAQEALQTLQAATLADPGYAEVRLYRVPRL